MIGMEINEVIKRLKKLKSEYSEDYDIFLVGEDYDGEICLSIYKDKEFIKDIGLTEINLKETIDK